MNAKIYRHTIVFTASVYASLRLTENVFRPSIERLWRKLSSEEALDLYAYVIVFLHDIAILSAKLAVAAGRDLRRWVDAYVDACLVQPTIIEEMIPVVVKEPIRMIPVAAKVMPSRTMTIKESDLIVEAIVKDTVETPVDEPNFDDWTDEQLRDELRRRGTKGYNLIKKRETMIRKLRG